MESVRTVRMWVELPTKIASQRQRKAVVRNWVSGNHLFENVPDTHPLSEAEKEREFMALTEETAAKQLIDEMKKLALRHGKTRWFAIPSQLGSRKEIEQ